MIKLRIGSGVKFSAVCFAGVFALSATAGADSPYGYCSHIVGGPMVYNGQEIADAARHSIFSNRDHGALGIDWSRADDAKARRRFAKVREFAALRHAHPELFDGPLVWNQTDDPDRTYSFTRMLSDGHALTLTVDIVSGDYTIERE